jgi:hypothetical protein
MRLTSDRRGQSRLRIVPELSCFHYDTVAAALPLVIDGVVSMIIHRVCGWSGVPRGGVSKSGYDVCLYKIVESWTTSQSYSGEGGSGVVRRSEPGVKCRVSIVECRLSIVDYRVI